MTHAGIRGRLVAVGLAGMLGTLSVQAAGMHYVVPGSEAAQLARCVEPTEFMRRNHMKLIRHQRDETVHNGIRSTKYSLKGCVACHVSYNGSRQPIPIVAQGQFCSTCHAHTAVTLDCFQCHAKVPAPDHWESVGLDAGGPGVGSDRLAAEPQGDNKP